MSEAPQGPGWWQASDGRWYPPHLHPSYGPPTQQPSFAPQHLAPGQRFGPQQPVAPGRPPFVPGQPPFGPKSQPGVPPRSGGVPKGLIVAGVVVLVVVALGYAAVSYVTGLVGDRLENAVGGDCTLVGKDDVDSTMSGEFDVIQLGGLTSIATPALDSRVLADGTTCWATETATSDEDTRLVRIARLDGDAAARFARERTIAQGVKEDRGGGLTVESQPYFNKDVTFGDEAFCTTTDFTGSSGVLVRRGDTLVYVSLTSGGIPTLDPDTTGDGAIKFADDDAHCDLAQKLAAKVR